MQWVFIVLKLLLLLSVLKVKKKIRRLVKGNIYYMQEFRITCDFSPIYNSEGHYYDYASKKQLKSVIFVQLAVSTVCSALCHN